MSSTADKLGFDSQNEKLFATVSRPHLEPTQYPIQMAQGTISLEVKPPRLEAGHSTYI
jgi:hypothetical protein